MNDATERARAALQRASSSPARALLARAREAASRGDGAGVAAELAGLPERERFVATVGLDLLFPAAMGPAAVALDAAVPAGRDVVDWSRLAFPPAMLAWGDLAIDHLPAQVLASLVRRAYYGSAGRLALLLVRRYLEVSRLEDARVLHGAIDVLAKSPRASARAAIALASPPEVRDAELLAAVAEASGAPIIQDGGEEVEALADLLAALDVLPASHLAVDAACRAIASLSDRFVDRKDTRAYGAALAVVACARAAANDTAWLDRAKTLRALVYGPAEHADAAIEAATTGAPIAESPPRGSVAVRSLESVRAEPRIESRAEHALEHVLEASRAGRIDDGLEALAVALEPTVPAVVTPDLVARFVESLPRGRAAALLALWAAPVLPERAYRLAPKVLDGDAARAFIERSIENGRVHATFSAEPYAPKIPVAGTLAEIAAPLGDEALAARVLEAALVIREHEEREGSENERQRKIRVGSVIAALAPRFGLEWVASRVGDADRARLAAAATEVAALGMTAVTARCGPIDSREGVPLAKAFADRGDLDAALTIAVDLDPTHGIQVLSALARPTLDPKTKKKLLAAFKKVPKLGSTKEDRTMRAHQLARLELALGDLDGALESLADLGDCRYAGHGPAALAREIAEHLDQHPAERTTARIDAILDTLCSDRVIRQELARSVGPLIEWGVLHAGPEHVAMHVTALRHRCAGADASHVDAGRAAGLARRGDHAGAAHGFDDALALTKHTQRAFFDPAALVRAARAASLAEHDPARFVAVIETFGLGDAGKAAHRASAAVADFGDAERAALRAGLARAELPAQLKAGLRTGLALADARAGDVEHVLRSLESAVEAAEVVERVGHLACALAVSGAIDAAEATAALVGMPVSKPAG